MTEGKDKRVGAMVRIQPITKTMIDLQLLKVNAARQKKMKPDLTIGEFVTLAIEHFDIKEAINN